MLVWSLPSTGRFRSRILSGPQPVSEQFASPEAIQAQLHRILTSRTFAHAGRLSRLLRYTVEQALAGQADQIKEYILGLQVFDKGEDFDPRLDPLVRVEAHRLRSRLRKYYETDGAGDPVLIEFPKGRYAPVFRTRPRVARPGVGRRARSVALAGALTLAGLFAYLAVTRMWRPPAAAPQPPSVAVLPLANLSGDPSQDFFADGMTDAIIGDLASLGGLRVISRTSAMHYKQVRKRLPEIARELQVAYVVEGSLNRAGERVRISAQLIEAATDRHLWAQSYERDLRDVLTLQKEVARAIAEGIKGRLDPREQRWLTVARPINPKTYEDYLKGRYQWSKRTEEGLRKSIEHFQQALAEDPGYALAYAGLAESYALLASYGVSPAREVMPKARAAAQRALQFDDTLAEAYASLGFVKSFYEWDWPGAGQDYRRALELNSNCTTARHWYAGYLRATGRLEEALAQMRQAQALDPLSRAISRDLGRTLYSMRRYDDAIREYRQALEFEPDFPSGYLHLGMAYLAQAKDQEALTALLKARSLPGGNPLILGGLGLCHGVLDQQAEARKILEELEARSRREYVSPMSRVLVHIGLKQNDQAFRELERACQERDGWLAWLNVDPLFDRLRTDPRLAQVVRRVGLAHR